MFGIPVVEMGRKRGGKRTAAAAGIPKNAVRPPPHVRETRSQALAMATLTSAVNNAGNGVQAGLLQVIVPPVVPPRPVTQPGERVAENQAETSGNELPPRPATQPPGPGPVNQPGSSVNSSGGINVPAAASTCNTAPGAGILTNTNVNSSGGINFPASTRNSAQETVPVGYPSEQQPLFGNSVTSPGNPHLDTRHHRVVSSSAGNASMTAGPQAVQNSAPIFVNNSGHGFAGGMTAPSNLMQGSSAVAGGENLLNNNFIPVPFVNECMPQTQGFAQIQNPLVSMCSPLGAELPLSVIAKIINSEYVDFANLLDKSALGEGDNKGLSLSVNQTGQFVWVDSGKSKQVINSIQSWTDAFLVFSSVFLGAHPSRAQELLKYANLIRTAASRYAGWGWKTYDTQFRLRQQRVPSRSWSIIDGELWTIYVATSSYNVNASRGTNPSSFRNGGQGKNQTGGSKRGGVCFEFNKPEGCKRQSCKFMHRCSKCNGAGHKAQFCKK